MAKQTRAERKKAKQHGATNVCPHCKAEIEEGDGHSCYDPMGKRQEGGFTKGTKEWAARQGIDLDKDSNANDPDATEVELTGFQAYALAEHSKLVETLQREMQDVDGRMNQLAHEVLKGAGVNYSDLKSWTFHIDAKGKRVVLRKEEQGLSLKGKQERLDK